MVPPESFELSGSWGLIGLMSVGIGQGIPRANDPALNRAWRVCAHLCRESGRGKRFTITENCYNYDIIWTSGKFQCKQNFSMWKLVSGKLGNELQARLSHKANDPGSIRCDTIELPGLQPETGTCGCCISGVCSPVTAQPVLIIQASNCLKDSPVSGQIP